MKLFLIFFLTQETEKFRDAIRYKAHNLRTYTRSIGVNGLVHIKKYLLHINEDEKKGPKKIIKKVFSHINGTS